ncbi:LytR C-terminal domain-containing protein [Bifidobacterium sp. 82T24]|uniref:LytR C-terminal domain-containing protein n=1 Tax=Bifidobacterium pluvialisilvae TaxID=2834436 RepID=UPI001C5880E4|nr:LytR C-terminal domain-containing protein [Bifidobacterium pluvialisilvae]MBW3087155.1 LytR C-terminal domain-containing protein [Bifidobacterium pluvialisilvae]
MSEKQHAAYPADEFDNPPQGPVGLHRGPRGFGARALPYIVVLAVAALIAVGVYLWASAGSGSSASEASATSSSSAAASTDKTASSAPASATATKSATASSTPARTASATPSRTATQSATPSRSATETTAPVNKSASITVYNGTRRTGLASTNATTLRNAGYSAVSARNPGSRTTLPSVSTVWYRSSADAGTAKDVAAQLGISQVVQVSGLGTDVAVVLMQ